MADDPAAGGGDRAARPVVDDDHGRDALECIQGAGQPPGPVAHRDHHRDRRDRWPGANRRTGVGDAGIEEATGQRTSRLAGADRSAALPGVDVLTARGPESENPDGMAADEDIWPGPADGPVEGYAEFRRRQGPAGPRRARLLGSPGIAGFSHRPAGSAGSCLRPAGGAGRLHLAVMPASTGRTAPVMPALSGPHSQAINAAGSSGVSSRCSRCWAANSSGLPRP